MGAGVSPVRGSGWYKRPYRISYVTGEAPKRVVKCYHWRGRRDEDARELARFPTVYRELRTYEVEQ
jgi:hypothetical protein